jgi:hypothetical protein
MEVRCGVPIATCDSWISFIFQGRPSFFFAECCFWLSLVAWGFLALDLRRGCSLLSALGPHSLDFDDESDIRATFMACPGSGH